MTSSQLQLDREEALSKVLALRSKYAETLGVLHSANEATTRLLLVDEFLQAIGWSKSEFHPEEAAGQVGYSDYLLTAEGTPRIVVEAKRTGHTFSSPAKSHTKQSYALNYLRSAFGRALTDVLDQATRYAQEHGVPFAVLTNGAEWIFAQVICTSGQPAEDLQAFYFGNLLTESADFELFWNLLSRSAVLEGRHAESFAEVNARQAEVSMYPREDLGQLAWAESDDGETELDEFYRAFFDEIVDPGRRNMLEHCFVTNTRLDQYQGQLKRVLRDTAPAFLDGAEEITPGDRQRLVGPETGDQKGRVVLVTGSIGCGKSTFVTKVLVEHRRSLNLSALLIDLIDDAEDDIEDVGGFLAGKVYTAWIKRNPTSVEYPALRELFHSDVEALKAGPRSRVFQQDRSAYLKAEAELLEGIAADRLRFLERCWRVNRNKGIGMLVFIDNVDRASEGFQRKAYGFAHRLASSTGATVIVPMREMTYYRGKHNGFLDVRSSDSVLHLQAPDLVALLSKRIRYIEKHLQQDHRFGVWSGREDSEQFFAKLTKYASAIKQTFLVSRTAQESIQLLAAVAWHDVRAFLQSLRRLHRSLGSDGGWLASDLIGAMLADSNRLPSTPLLPNLFVPPYPSFACFFLKFRIVARLLYAPGDEATRRGLSQDQILRTTRLYGYHDRWARRALEEMVRERLLECMEAPAAVDYTNTYQLSSQDSFRASPLAVVLVESLLQNPGYLAIIGNDLPFHDRNTHHDYVRRVRDGLGSDVPTELKLGTVEQLVAAGVGRAVAEYLALRLVSETPPGNMRQAFPEVGAAENRIGILTAAWAEAAGDGGRDTSPRPSKARPIDAQLDLLEVLHNVAPPEVGAPLAIPPNLSRARLEGSHLAALILWALVAFDALGKVGVTGVAIARILNDLALSEHEKKESTNISRALRSPVLRSQSWLVVAGKTRRFRYSLGDGWKEAWVQAFSQAPPKRNPPGRPQH